MKQIAVVCAIGFLLAGCGNPKVGAASEGAGSAALSGPSMRSCIDAGREMEKQEVELGDPPDTSGQQSSLRAAAVKMLETCKPAWEKFDADMAAQASDPDDEHTNRLCKDAHNETIGVLEDFLSNNRGDEYINYAKKSIEDTKECVLQIKIREKRLSAEAKY